MTINNLDKKKKWAVLQLQEKFKELGRLPKKDDFDEITKSRIKAFLGPWPRALEAAELKEPKTVPKTSKKTKAKSKSKEHRLSALKKLSHEQENVIHKTTKEKTNEE